MIDRLDRIERLDRSGAPAELLLEELRALVGEAESWARSERSDAALDAVERCRAALLADRVA